MSNTKFIGIAGVARCGKDTFCQNMISYYAEDGIVAKRYALADKLKELVREPLLKLSGIDVLNCNDKEKSIIRDYLVSVGKIKRVQTDGTYWTSLVEKQIEEESPDIAIITDIRYDFYPEDEATWLKTKHKGKLIHISRYKRTESNSRLYVAPANKDEEENNPKLLEKADFKVKWETTDKEFWLKLLTYSYMEHFKK